MPKSAPRDISPSTVAAPFVMAYSSASPEDNAIVAWVLE
jgi:hypothetical protein